MDKINDNAKLIGAALVGAVAGVALGVLFAPNKGSITRKKLMGNLGELADDAKQKLLDDANAFRERAKQLEEIAENTTFEISKRAKQNLDISSNHR